MSLSMYKTLLVLATEQGLELKTNRQLAMFARIITKN